MQKQTLLFYDVETTGLNKCFDQVLQFAAIRTDLDLNEISRHEIQIKRNHDIVPSPHAIITHHIGMSNMQTGTLEVEAIQEIHHLLNQAGTISLGYNTLGFDDELLRFSFYRNLLTPYTHQYANQCGRMDIYPLTVLYYLFNHGALNWPSINGTISLKLEHIAHANNLMTGPAHNALIDVEATLALAKRLKINEKMWEYACGYFHKQTDIERGDRLPICLETEDRLFRDALIVSAKFSARNNFIAPVISLGQHKHYKNQTLWLRLDTEELSKTNNNNIAETTYAIRKKMGEQVIVLPPEERYCQHMSSDRLKMALGNKKRLLENKKLLCAIADYYQHYKYPFIPHVDIDADLYNQPFSTPYEDKQYRDFHAAKLTEKALFARKISKELRKKQALRILGRHYPSLLSEQEQASFTDYCESSAIDFRGNNKLTWIEARKQALQLQQETTLSDQQRKLLDEFLCYPTP